MRNLFVLLIIICTCTWNCNKAGADATAAAVSGKGGSTARFTIVGNYLYIVDAHDLKVLDISNPSSAILKNTVHVGFEIETIFPFKDNLFIGSTTAVHIFSITDPVNPKKLSEAISPSILRRCDPVVAKDNVAFATLRTNGPCGGTISILAVYDITDISKPAQRAHFELSEPYGLGYSNDVLYVCDRFAGLMLFDITTPFQPALLKSINDGSYLDVISFQNSLICWVVDGVIIYDITDNRNPVLMAKIN